MGDCLIDRINNEINWYVKLRAGLYFLEHGQTSPIAAFVCKFVIPKMPKSLRVSFRCCLRNGHIFAMQQQKKFPC